MTTTQSTNLDGLVNGVVLRVVALTEWDAVASFTDDILAERFEDQLMAKLCLHYGFEIKRTQLDTGGTKSCVHGVHKGQESDDE